MKKYYPDRHCMTTLRVAVVLVLFAVLFLTAFFIPVKLLVIIISVTAAAIAFFAFFIYIPLFFSSLTYIATDTEIIFSGGVFIKTHQSARYSSVQYTSVISSPFSQYTGLNFVIFYVYGGQITFLFLSQADAQEIIRLTSGIVGEEQ